MRDALRSGDILAGRYRIVSPLGHGGMGAVYAAEHQELGTRVALKTMDPVLATSTDALARFRREARTAAAIRSPNIVQITDFGVDGDMPFIVMELLEGQTLRAALRQTPRLALADVGRVVGEVARGAAKAHAGGVVHRDLKPENIFLARVDEAEVVKILDFGIAKVGATPSAVDPLTRTGAALGTPQYMSPEQVEGRREVDLRADLWALAVIAFECLCGRPPFAGATIGELVLQICTRPLPVPSQVAAVPAAFDAWFARAAAREPEDRFASASALSDALQDALAASLSTGPTLAAATAQAANAGAPTELRGGDDNAGYVLAADRPARMLHLRLWGHWDLALGAKYRVDMMRAIDILGGTPWVSLGDATRFPPQRPEIAEMLGELRGVGKRRGCERAASVVGSAVALMQVRRLFTESGIEFQPFLDFNEAKAWLGR